MYVLVVDSSTAAVTAALVTASLEVVAERTTVDARAHGELLAPHVDAVLREAGIRPRDLAAVVAGVGPGPFTGLRVGLVTAAVLGQSLAIPTYGVCSLDALGFGQDGTVLVATDARRREVYWAVYRDGVRQTGPAVAKPDVVADEATALGATFAVGEGAQRYAVESPDGDASFAGRPALPVREEPRYPPAVSLAALAADRVRAGKPSERLTPLYLRRPDAVAPGLPKSVLT